VINVDIRQKPAGGWKEMKGRAQKDPSGMLGKSMITWRETTVGKKRVWLERVWILSSRGRRAERKYGKNGGRKDADERNEESWFT